MACRRLAERQHPVRDLVDSTVCGPDTGDRKQESNLLDCFTRVPVPPCSDTTGPRLERNLDLGVTARRRRSNGGGNAVRMLPNAGPPGAAGQNDQSDAPYSQVLLVADASIGRDQQLEPRIFRGVQQR